jgi:DNA polymerase-3 subunit beta
MHIIAERDALLSAVSFVERRAKGTAIPILNNLLLTAGNSTLAVAGHSLDSSAEASLPVDCRASGAITVPAKNLAALLHGAREGSEISMRLDAATLHVQFGKSRYKLPTLPVADFPPPLAVKPNGSLELSAADVVRVFKSCTKIADPTNTSNPAYAGLYLHSVGKRLAAVACDGHQLLRVATETEFAGHMPSLILTAGAIDEILRVGADDGGTLAWSAGLLSFRRHGWLFTTKLIDAQFPDYTRIIPETDGPFLEFDRDEMIECVGRLSSLSESKGIMSVEWDDNPTKLALSFTGNGSGQEEVECSPCEMPASGFGAPPWQLVRLLECIAVDRVRFHVNDPRKPFRISAPSRPDILGMQVPCYIAPQQREAA